jgi:hypothetical protein
MCLCSAAAMDGDGDNNASLELRSKLRKRGTRSSSNPSVFADVVVCYLISKYYFLIHTEIA